MNLRNDELLTSKHESKLSGIALEHHSGTGDLTPFHVVVVVAMLPWVMFASPVRAFGTHLVQEEKRDPVASFKLANFGSPVWHGICCYV